MILDELIETLENYKKDYGGNVEVEIAYNVDWTSFQKTSEIDFYYYPKYLTDPLLLLIAVEKSNFDK